MKKLVAITLLLPLLGVAQSKSRFLIQGNIKGLTENTQVNLLSGADGKSIASAKMVNGIFYLRGELKEPELCQISFAGYKEQLDLFIANDTVNMVIDLADIKNVKITGSALQEEYLGFKQEFYPYFEKLNTLGNTINAEKDAGKKNGLIQEYLALKTTILNAGTNFTNSHPASPVSSLLLVAVMRLYEGPAELEAKYEQLQPAAKKGALARIIEKTIADAKATKIGAVGTQALEFSQKDVNGKAISLSSFKGKYVLVDFWASWCKPCRQENPNVVNAYQVYKGKNFTVLGVSLDQSKPNWLAAIKADNLEWTHVSDLQYWNNAVAQLYGIQSIPANMLIDPTGKIIARDLRGEALPQILKELLK